MDVMGPVTALQSRGGKRWGVSITFVSPGIHTWGPKTWRKHHPSLHFDHTLLLATFKHTGPELGKSREDVSPHGLIWNRESEKSAPAFKAKVVRGQRRGRERAEHTAHTHTS